MIYGLPSSAYEKSIVRNLVLNSDKFFPCTQTEIVKSTFSLLDVQVLLYLNTSSLNYSRFPPTTAIGFRVSLQFLAVLYVYMK